MPYFRTAATWGALVGFCLYLGVGILLTLIGNAVAGSSSTYLTLGCLGFFLLLFAFSAAGYLAGQSTGRASAGAIAGMVALLVYGVLEQLYEPASTIAQTASTTSASTTPSVSTTALIVAQIITDVLFLGIAAGLGWLGGRPGAQRAQRQAGLAAEVPAAERADA